MPKPIPQTLQYFISDCLQDDSAYTVKSMFGGYGMYKYGKIFSIYAFDAIYMKTHDNNLQDYIDAGAKQFEFEKKTGKIARMGYYVIPDEVMEDRDKLNIWIEKALDY